MSGRIKIIGGLFRGKNLIVQEHSDLRPTPNRVRETLFNWLMHDIHNLHCYDAFAGSGALGFEAYSRGAPSVIFTENNHTNYQVLQKNITTFKPPQQNKDLSTPLKAYLQDFFQFIKNSELKFDLIFLDPPYKAQLLPQCLELLQSLPVLKTGGLVYLESDKTLPLTTNISDQTAKHWEIIKNNKAASIYFGIYRKVS